MITGLLALLPRRRPLFVLLGLHATQAVLQGLLLALLFPVLGALLAPEPDLGAATPWLTAGAVGVLAAWVLAVVTNAAGYSACTDLANQLRMALLRHTTVLPLGRFTPDGRSRLIRAAHVAASLATTVVVIAGPVVTGFVVPATVVVVVAFVDGRAALLMGAVLVVAAVVLRWNRRVTADVVDDIEAAGAEINGRALEFGAAQAVLRAAGTAQRGTVRMREALAEHRRRYAAGLRRLLLPDQTYLGVVLVGSVLVLVLVAERLVAGTAPVGEVVALLVLVTRYLEPLAGVVGQAGTLGVVDTAVRKLDDVLTARPLPAPTAPVTALGGSDIVLDDVTFTYPGADTPALSGVSLRCPAGATTALVGPSGSGKTTIVRLVARFFDIDGDRDDGGAVRVGGVDVRDYDPATLLDGLAIVFQEVYLFDLTIEENLRMARPEATAAELATAARDARLDEVVDRLPDGWQTRVGPGGAQLSGGERQRVSIARAFLKAAPVVLVDEAASALDPENELAVAQALARLSADPNRTVVVIAHRPATLAAADHVVALDGGRVVESGSPAALLAAGGTLSRLHTQYERARSWRITT